MKVKAYRRYCHKQMYGSSILGLADQLEKHPGSIIEFNERSTAKPYRIVTIAEVDVEVPDPPDAPRPDDVHPLPLDDENVEERIDEIEKPPHPGWGSKTDKHLVLTHTPTGTTVSRYVWNYNSPAPWERSYLRRELEQKLDPTWEERRLAHQEEMKAWNSDRSAWDTLVKKALKEAIKK